MIHLHVYLSKERALQNLHFHKQKQSSKDQLYDALNDQKQQQVWSCPCYGGKVHK